MEHRGMSARLGSAGGRASAQEGVAGQGFYPTYVLPGHAQEMTGDDPSTPLLNVKPPCGLGCTLVHWWREMIAALTGQPTTTVHQVTQVADGGPSVATVAQQTAPTAAAAVQAASTTPAIDPTTGWPIDPASGLPQDPQTGLLFDPSTGTYYDSSGNVVDPSSYSGASASDGGGGGYGPTDNGGSPTGGGTGLFWVPPPTPVQQPQQPPQPPQPVVPMGGGAPLGVHLVGPQPVPLPHITPTGYHPQLPPTKPAPTPIHIGPLHTAHGVQLGAARTPAVDALCRDAVFAAITGGR